MIGTSSNDKSPTVIRGARWLSGYSVTVSVSPHRHTVNRARQVDEAHRRCRRPRRYAVGCHHLPRHQASPSRPGSVSAGTSISDSMRLSVPASSPDTAHPVSPSCRSSSALRAISSSIVYTACNAALDASAEYSCCSSCPCRAIPHRLLTPRLPRLAQPRLDVPCPPCLAQHSQSAPRHSMPHLARLVMPHPTGPSLSGPALQRPAGPRPAVPIHSTPALPRLAMPRLA